MIALNHTRLKKTVPQSVHAIPMKGIAFSVIKRALNKKIILFIQYFSIFALQESNQKL
jgi:hypothetical protein